MELFDFDQASVALCPDEEIYNPSVDLRSLFPELEESDWNFNDQAETSFNNFSSEETSPASQPSQFSHPSTSPTSVETAQDLGTNPPEVCLEEFARGPEPLDYPSTHGSDITNFTPPTKSAGKAPRKNTPSRKRNARLPQPAVNILKTWFQSHRTNPYPTENEKEELEMQTSLTRGQISIWLANKRRRNVPNGLALLEPDPETTCTIAETQDCCDSSFVDPQSNTYKSLNPFQRWKAFPPEYEPAFLPDIARAVATVSEAHSAGNDAPVDQLNPNSEFGQPSTCSISAYDELLAPSVVSYETGLTSMYSGPSKDHDSASSYRYCASHHSLSFPRQTHRQRRRRRGKQPSSYSDDLPIDRPFQCTFCNEHCFKTKHDWQRHEKAVHLGLDIWTCCTQEPTIDTPLGRLCNFCDELEPDESHVEMHNLLACDGKSIPERTFYRKDHFNQHLRVVHQSKLNTRIEQQARTKISDIKSTCGFCGTELATWTDRANHLGAHFKGGARMKDWKGDWGFEPHIQDLLERATLPGNSMEALDLLNLSGEGLETGDNFISSLNEVGSTTCMGPPLLPASFGRHALIG